MLGNGNRMKESTEGFLYSRSLAQTSSQASLGQSAHVNLIGVSSEIAAIIVDYNLVFGSRDEIPRWQNCYPHYGDLCF